MSCKVVKILESETNGSAWFNKYAGSIIKVTDNNSIKNYYNIIGSNSIIPKDCVEILESEDD